MDGKVTKGVEGINRLMYKNTPFECPHTSKLQLSWDCSEGTCPDCGTVWHIWDDAGVEYGLKKGRIKSVPFPGNGKVDLKDTLK